MNEKASVRGTRRIFTFDAGGISGHANHVDTHHGVRASLAQLDPAVSAWALRTEPMLWKYAGPLGTVSLIVVFLWKKYSVIFDNVQWGVAGGGPTSRTLTYASIDLALSWRAMRAHASQWVWYRKLFVLFSSYSWRNDFDRIDPEPVE